MNRAHPASPFVWLLLSAAAVTTAGAVACVGSPASSTPLDHDGGGGSELDAAHDPTPEEDGGDGGEVDSGEQVDGSTPEPPSVDPVLVAIGNGQSAFRSLTFDAAGNIYAVGWAASGTDRVSAIAKFHPNGKLDESFGSGGYTLVNVSAGGTREQLVGIVVLPNGKLLAAGVAEESASSTVSRGALLRLDAKGSPDVSFGLQGVRRLPLAKACTLSQGFESDVVAGIGSMGDKVFVYGSHCVGTDRQLFAAKLNDDGTPDKTYGVNGFAEMVPRPAGKNCGGASGLVMADGSVVVGGWMEPGSFETRRAVVAKFDPTGNPAAGFGTASVFRENTFPNEALTSVSGLAVDGNYLLVTGTLLPGGEEMSSVIGAWRIGAQNGGLDLSHGTPDGYVKIQEPPLYMLAGGAAVLKDGRHVLAGQMGTSQEANGVIVVTASDGKLDTSFAPKGTKIYDIGKTSAADGFAAIATAPSGTRVVAVGSGTSDAARAAIHVIDF